MQRNVRFQKLQFIFGLVVALAISPSLGQDLPPEIQVDRLLVQVDRETAEDEHGLALITLERILEIYEQHALQIPAEFWFRQAGVLQAAGFHEGSIEAATQYLREAGRDGEHYQAALQLLDTGELRLTDARQAEREAAERAAVIASSVPEMVAIPAGTFRMGCATRGDCDQWESPVHEVRVARFELSKYEVTFAQWDVCTEYGDCRWVSDEGWGRGDRPVINVNWHDAQQFLQWLSRETGESYRLPSEAEWEYAARAGAETQYSWGNDIGLNRANCDRCGSQWDLRQTAPAGSFAANAFGVHDMHGNVHEWVEDCWNEGYAGAPADGSAWRSGECSERVVRGGSWVHTPWYMRSTYRWGTATGDLGISIGFRVARTLTP